MNHRQSFIETIEQISGIDNASDVLDYYIKERIVRIDKRIGQFQVTHGAFLDKDVLIRASRAVQ
jgi:hypothetical protein